MRIAIEVTAYGPHRFLCVSVISAQCDQLNVRVDLKTEQYWGLFACCKLRKSAFWFPHGGHIKREICFVFVRHKKEAFLVWWMAFICFTCSEMMLQVWNTFLKVSSEKRWMSWVIFPSRQPRRRRRQQRFVSFDAKNASRQKCVKAFQLQQKILNE